MVRLKHRATGYRPTSEMFKEIHLDFSDGKNFSITLNDQPFTSGLIWSELVLSNQSTSENVRILVMDVYSTGNNGFSEIHFYDCMPGR